MVHKKITEIFELKKGATYWIHVGDECNPMSEEQIKKVKEKLVTKFGKDFSFVVTNHLIRPVPVERTEVTSK